jgi:hypothetical protein
MSEPQRIVERHRIVFIAWPAVLIAGLYLALPGLICPMGCTSHAARVSPPCLHRRGRSTSRDSGAPLS